jgi:hypothetical protein
VPQPESATTGSATDQNVCCESRRHAFPEIILSNRPGTIDLHERHCGTGDRAVRYVLGDGVSEISSCASAQSASTPRIKRGSAAFGFAKRAGDRDQRRDALDARIR